MDDLITRDISLQNNRLSHRSQELKQQLMTYQVLGYLPAREGAFKNIESIRKALDEIERLLHIPRYPGDTFKGNRTNIHVK